MSSTIIYRVAVTVYEPIYDRWSGVRIGENNVKKYEDFFTSLEAATDYAQVKLSTVRREASAAVYRWTISEQGLGETKRVFYKYNNNGKK